MSTTDLSGAAWLQRPETQAIFAALDGHLRRTRAVGGVVRDTVMGHEGRENPDIDLATELTPEEVIRRAEAAGIAHYATGIAHGTVTLRLGETLTEVTTLRQDVETDGRHAVVQFGTDWKADASRRDFTLNALYCAADGTLYDPLGGLPDALAGRVRFIGVPAERIAEDGLRVYRFFRFSASHGGENLDADGLRACADAAGRLDHLSAERVGSEMLRMLALPKVTRTLGAMAAIGLVAIEEPALRRLAQYEALGGHSIAARLVLLGIDLDALQSRWRLSNEVVRAAGLVQQAAGLMGRERVADAAYRCGEAAVEGLAVAAAEQNWGRERVAELARELGRLVVAKMPVSGDDLAGLGVAPGPAMGKELARLEQIFIDSGFTLSKEELLARVAG
ncbi:CCA tRNA nucleotidyltransferase [Devosia albogilva]|uniref:CCA tRNA nucleotidyltransferase n=1 Tax=Devosia albogilva TaxID=429726 RepID=A0ABW5QGR4_9HYPH